MKPDCAVANLILDPGPWPDGPGHDTALWDDLYQLHLLPLHSLCAGKCVDVEDPPQTVYPTLEPGQLWTSRPELN